MDYEKKIREYLNSSEVDQLYKNMLLNLFPELKESEGEGIRKEILAFINLKKSLGSMNQEQLEKSNSWIAWLEKPKTEKVYLWFKVGDVVCSSNGTTLKIVGITDYCYNCITTDNNVYSFSFDIQDEFELVEDKKEWSEEDEKMLGYAIKAVHNMYVGKHHSCVTDIYVKADNWLKSIKNRYTWKPSEEELSAVLVARNNVNSINADILRKLYNELKKL